MPQAGAFLFPERGPMGLLSKFRGESTSRVRMTHSVGELVAGEQYDLPVTLADTYLARGYCEGNFSREYSDVELAGLRSNVQTVVL